MQTLHLFLTLLSDSDLQAAAKLDQKGMLNLFIQFMFFDVVTFIAGGSLGFYLYNNNVL